MKSHLTSQSIAQKMNRKLVYISGPYANGGHGVERNISIARNIAIRLWEEGYGVICPHLNTQHFEWDCLCEWQDYMDGDLTMVERSDLVVMIPGWEDSKGAVIERDHAIRKGIPVYEYPHYPPHGKNGPRTMQDVQGDNRKDVFDPS